MLAGVLKPASQNGTQRLRPWCRKLSAVALAAACLLTATSSRAVNLIWDAGNTNNGATIDSASGNWDVGTTNLNWNTNGLNVTWTQTSTTAPLNGATFSGPNAAAGTYQVDLDGGQIAFNNLAINNSGYVFSGGALYQPAGDILSVSNGVSVTFSNLITGPNSSTSWYVGAGGPAASTMSCVGGWSGMQLAICSTNNSTVVYMGGNVSGGVFFPNANIIQTNGTMNYTATWNMGRPGAAGTGAMPLAGSTTWPASWTVNGPNAAISQNAALDLSRGGGSSTFNLINGTVTQNGTARPVVGNDNTANEHAAFYVQGGTMTCGNSASAAPIVLHAGGAGANATAVFSQSGGTVYAWGGLQIGTTSAGTPGANSIAAFTNSGGFLYLGNVGSVGITLAVYPAATNIFDFTGGTVGALQSWQSAAPLTLDSLNGNITFQCADNNGSQNNITLSGALTGPGGLYKTGGGTLTLSGANNYAGSTVVSNGILYIKPISTPTNGSVTLDGSAASPTMTLAPVSTGQYMDINGNLTYANGTVTADFNFGSLPPSTSVAPIQVTNNVVCAVMPQITIEGSSIPAGTFALIQYGGSVAGAGGLPAAPISLPASTTGYITNIFATKTIALVVTSSPVSPSLVWSVASGGWDFSAAQNWKLFGVATRYSEPNSVQFDDSVANRLPVTITNDAIVNPSAITVLGTNTWTILGNNAGSIAGSATITKVGSGTLILNGTNSYTGGTIIEGGQLNINNGGDTNLTDSAIGTGPLTLDLGTKVDNTSGQSITLQPTVAENWVDDWTFVGSANFNTGLGAITLGSGIVVLTVVSNTLEVDGSISDNGNVYKLEKAGNGALTLGADSSFTGGLQLDSGLLNLKSPNCLGDGAFNFNGSATLDNLSGGDLTISGITGTIGFASGTLTYLGTSNSLFFAVNCSIGSPSVFNVVSNTLGLGVICGNSTATKMGAGTLVMGAGSSYEGYVNQGELDLGAPSGASISTGNAVFGLLVQSNAVAKVTGYASQFMPAGAPASYPVPAKLSSGGVLDLNGNSQTISQMLMTNGVLRTSLAATPCALTIPASPAGLAINLAGTNTFDVPDAAAELDINGDIAGAGSLVKTGLGLLNLMGTNGYNSYTGNTTINGGTLTINGEYLATNSTVTINTNALLGINGMLNLNFTDLGTNTVAALILGGASMQPGVHNASTDPAYLAGLGSLLIVPVPTINPLPGMIQVKVSGSTLALSWPTNLGWLLQSQTNALNVGLLTNSSAWFNVLGSDQVTSTNLTINPANGAVFYRMVHP